MPVITMISIDFKITNFSLYLLVYLFGNNFYNIGELTNTTFKRKNDHKYYFRRWHIH